MALSGAARSNGQVVWPRIILAILRYTTRMQVAAGLRDGPGVGAAKLMAAAL